MKTRGIGGLAALATLLFAASCQPPERTAVGAPQILRVSNRNEPSDLDPAKATLPDEFAILRTLLEGLLIPGPTGRPPLPGLATHFELSPDGLIYTFHLRTEAAWSDGVPLSAPQLVAAYQRLLTPATAAPKANVFFPVKNARAFVSGDLPDFSAVGLRASGPHTLVVTLEKPTPRFPYYVASGPWLPVRTDLVARYGRNWTRPENFAGNGAFTLTEWRADQRIIVRKNPRWHGAQHVRLEEIHFMRFDSGDTEERAYRAGQIDATMSVPSSKVEVYARERPSELQRAPMIETRYLSFNTLRPPLDLTSVRRALALALDRQKLVEHVLRGGQPATGRLVPPALREPGELTALPPDHHYDPATARKLLAEAGYDPKKFPRLEICGWSASQVAILEAIQAMWRQELGLEITITIREAKVHLSTLAAGDYDIAFITAIPDVADAVELLGDYVTAAPENYPHWHHPAFDAQITAARQHPDRATRAGHLFTAERQLLEDAPLSPLYFNSKIWLMNLRLRGWEEDGLWSRNYHTVYFSENK
jgi:oligopeptide transport system substrate-binding protein